MVLIDPSLSIVEKFMGEKSVVNGGVAHRQIPIEKLVLTN
jgi:hypothetical protein